MDPSKNYCVVCGIDIGDCNPRQLCCKTYCPNTPIDMTPEIVESDVSDVPTDGYDSQDDVIFHDLGLKYI